jgi:phosphoribosylaminoimidazole-succinocarboxamide synthase
MPVDESILRSALNTTLESTDLYEFGTKVQGKVRDSYVTGDGRRILVVTDRVSAFDMILGTIPFKGQVLSTLAAWWFEQTRDVVPNHMLAAPDPNVMVAKQCTPLHLEFVVRAYLTGVTSTSIWTHYAKGKREFCGHKLPNGLKQHQRLPELLLTPSTKAEHGGHDESISRADAISRGIITASDFDQAADYALALFRHGQALSEQRGLLLVDTKYEFGKTADGQLVVMDEIHTPDSSRYWYRDTYEAQLAAGQAPTALDKEYIRRWLSERGYSGEGLAPRLTDEVRVQAATRYIAAFEQLCGVQFVPNRERPELRIRRALQSYFA